MRQKRYPVRLPVSYPSVVIKALDKYVTDKRKEQPSYTPQDFVRKAVVSKLIRKNYLKQGNYL